MDKGIPVIIVNWNGISDTIECIESIHKMPFNYYHIYLIDNGSDNAEFEELENKYADYKNVSVIGYKENLGFAKAHIKIWQDILINSDTKYIALLNNDTIVTENWLEEMLSYADSHKVDIVSSKMIDYNKRHLMDNAGHQMLNTGEIIPIGFGKPIEDYNDPKPNLGACAGACLYRTSMLKSIGFFDPFFSTGYEDAEFSLRAVIAGYSSSYNPKAIVYHKGGASIKKVFNIEYSIMIQTSILYSYFKLVPLKNIILSTPSIIFKNLCMLLINIIFRRWHYLHVWRKSWSNIFSLRTLIREKRKTFYNQIQHSISFWELSFKTNFFLLFDISRFWSIIILKRTSALDRY